MRIRQAYVSHSLRFFAPLFFKKYDMVPYHNPDEPSIFYGCYLPEDFEALSTHRSRAVLIWGGSDLMSPLGVSAVRQLVMRKGKQIDLIAGSSFLARDLDYIQLPYRQRNIVPIDPEQFNPVPLGPDVYCYAGYEQKQDFYGYRYLAPLKERFPDVNFRVYYSNPQTLPHEQIHEVYAECFLGLRLVPHDACSCTVTELGLMGRKCVWNGSLPNAIPWRDLDSIVRIIERERRYVGTVDAGLAQRVREAISEEDWLYIEGE